MSTRLRLRWNVLLPRVWSASESGASFCSRCGTDLKSAIDAVDAEDFPAHDVLLSNELEVVECLASLDALAAVGGLFVAAPLKITGGSGSPARAFVFVPREA